MISITVNSISSSIRKISLNKRISWSK